MVNRQARSGLILGIVILGLGIVVSCGALLCRAILPMPTAPADAGSRPIPRAQTTSGGQVQVHESDLAIPLIIPVR